MKLNKEHNCLLFCFYQKKNAAKCTQNYLWDVCWKCYSH